MSRDYIIAGHRMRIHEPFADLAADGLRGFAPFEAEYDAEAATVLELHTDRRLKDEDFDSKVLHSFPFEEAHQECFFCRYGGGYLFRMRPEGYEGSDRDTIFILPDGSRTAESNVAVNGAPDISLLRFGLWMMFGLAVNPLHAIAIHSSTIVKNGMAVMFLGESGTGKSTHTRLWRENIDGARLLNDDSPFICCKDGVPTACGSAWSGKTPCYVNRSYPIRAIVRLSQAPHNKIQKLSTIRALGALLPSCPPAFAYDTALQDNICDTLSDVLAKTEVYHLECLPDADAARLVYNTLFGQN